MININSKDIKEHFSDLESTFSWWGKREPYFSVLTAPQFLSHNMTEQEKEKALSLFYELGEADISFALEILEHNGITISPTMALDFGCGLGRLTFALSKLFRFVIGCDISEPHLEISRENACKFGINNVHFVKSSTNLLERLEPESFDFIYSRLVLQHIPPALSIAYIRQFTSLLKAGGYMFIQLPTKPYNYQLNIESFGTAQKVDDSSNCSNDEETESDIPRIEMFAIEIREVLEAINEGKCRLIDLILETDRDGWNSRIFLIKKDG